MSTETSHNNGTAVDSISAYAKAGMVVIGGSIVVLSVLAAPFLLVPASKKLGYLPWMATPNSAIRRALNEVGALQQGHKPNGNASKTLSIVDLGSGDGRLCIMAAKEYGYKSVGIELNPVLVGLSYYKACKAGYVIPVSAESRSVDSIQAGSDSSAPPSQERVLSRVQFRMQDFWTVPLHTFDVITVFGVRSIMARLEEKVAAEAQDELHVVCYRFPLPNKEPVYAKDELFIYRFCGTDLPLERKDGACSDDVATLYRRS